MGVVKTIIKEGSGRTPKSGEVVICEYVGTLKEGGDQFDSSRDRGKPLTFMIGIGSVIKGWDEGIMEMKLGEVATLEVSADYGYGADGAGDKIPPNADCPRPPGAVKRP
jgi:FKBP-type peptidyl-prolyl cis-trans isomerase